MKLIYSCFLALLCCIQTGYSETEGEIEFISISYPEGEDSLRVWEDGRASLFYGALPQSKIIKRGTFNTKQLYEQVRPRLHPNLPVEDWPDPKAERGMVTIQFKGKETEKSYLIFNEQEFANALFDKARRNIVGDSP